MLGFNGGRLGSKNLIEENGIVEPSSDPYYDDVGLILNGGDFVDGSKYAATVTSTGVDLDTGNTNFGNASYQIDSDSDVLSVPDQGQFDLGTNDFTIEGWAYRTSSNSSFRCLFQKRRGSGSTAMYIWFGLYSSNRFYIYISQDGASWNIANGTNTGVALPADTWTHYAVCREGSNIRIFIGGTLATTITTSAAIANDPTSPFGVGTDNGTNGFDGGRFAGFRFTNGIARYTANFTPPTALFGTGVLGFKASGMWTLPEVSRLRRTNQWPPITPTGPVSTDLVLYVDAGNTDSYPGSGTTWTNLATPGTNDVTLVNGPTFTTDDGGSLVFDGSNDYCTTNSTLSAADELYAASGNSWSVTSFFNTDSVSSGECAINSKGGGTGTNANYVTYRDGGNLRVRIRGGTKATLTAITANTWYEVTVTWDGSTAKAYVNGAYVQNVNVGSASNSYNFNIGATRNGTLQYFDGKIPVVLVYGKALTDAEVEYNFNIFRGRYGI